jgi:ankyrin repeat protein
VEFLLAAGIDKNAINSDGNTALMLAAGSDKREVADTLLAAEVDVDVRNAANHTALMYATSAEIVDALVKSGVDVDATDQDGNSALHRVAEDGEEAVVSSSVAGWGKCRRKEQGRRDRA